jgi:hypothetical protein
VASVAFSLRQTRRVETISIVADEPEKRLSPPKEL